MRPSSATTTTATNSSGPTSSSSWMLTTTLEGSRRCAASRPTNTSFRSGRKTPNASGSTRHTTSRDRTVNDQLEPAHERERHFICISAFQNFDHLSGCPPPLLSQIDGVCEKAPIANVLAERIDGREL